MENALDSRQKRPISYEPYLTAFKFTLAKGVLIPILVTGGSFQANNQIPEILFLLFLWN